ncbi:MAG: hypothetical protein HYZ83_07260 [Candidatus Omnitrophica bacterium]|nr:hypothetical protein [Candidatus Omnitrophota bacterium]
MKTKITKEAWHRGAWPLLLLLFIFSSSVFASPWAENQGYFPKVFGKLGFGLKNTFLGWTQMFIESTQPKYKTDWEGFCVGMAGALIYTGNGLVHLVTFPIPLDVPDLGKGVHIPERARDRSMEHPKEEAIEKAMEKLAAPEPAASPTTSESVTEEVPAPQSEIPPAESIPVPTTVDTGIEEATQPSAEEPATPGPAEQETASSEADSGLAARLPESMLETTPSPAPTPTPSPTPSPSPT